MMREVDLITYLPPIMKRYYEMQKIMAAENPELNEAWKAAENVLNNAFISTADEYGISRYEKLLSIRPSVYDSLESRRKRVETRWLDRLPYTFKMFCQILTALCGENNFTITKRFTEYCMEIETHLSLDAAYDELQYIFRTIIPCNLTVISRNTLPQCKIDLNIMTSLHISTHAEYNLHFATFDPEVNIKSWAYAGSFFVMEKEYNI